MGSDSQALPGTANMMSNYSVTAISSRAGFEGIQVQSLEGQSHRSHTQRVTALGGLMLSSHHLESTDNCMCDLGFSVSVLMGPWGMCSPAYCYLSTSLSPPDGSSVAYSCTL